MEKTKGKKISCVRHADRNGIDAERFEFWLWACKATTTMEKIEKICREAYERKVA